jgi:uncharacterized protein (DUF1330 family)
LAARERSVAGGQRPDQHRRAAYIPVPVNEEVRVKHYAVAELDIEHSAWVNDYVNDVTPMVERRGGRYLARSTRIERIEGEREPPQLLLIIEWPSKAAAEEFYASEEYRPYREARRAGARNEFLLVSGEDVNGLARIAS